MPGASSVAQTAERTTGRAPERERGSRQSGPPTLTFDTTGRPERTVIALSSLVPGPFLKRVVRRLPPVQLLESPDADGRRRTPTDARPDAHFSIIDDCECVKARGKDAREKESGREREEGAEECLGRGRLPAAVPRRAIACEERARRGRRSP